MTEAKIDLVRWLFVKHNEGSEAVLEAYDEFFHPDLEWIPTIVGGPEGARYRGRSLATGRASGAEISEEIGLVFGFEEGRIRIDRAYPSHSEAERAAEELAAEAHA